MMARRFVRDESGMTLGLAMMMILLMGVMGAGLLTFVSKDLNTVLEDNRAQRAFEVADAGVGAAGRQLASNVVREDYNGDGAGNCGADDIQWSALRCDDPDGMTLNDLDGDGDPKDSVYVTIEYKAEDPGVFPEHFLVISEGTYGVAKRKIETIFKGVEVAAGGGESIGHPIYYTPSDIRIEAGVNLNGISFFSKQDILIEDVTDPLSFVDEYETPGGTLSYANTDDELCDWDTDTPLHNCFEDATGMWNTEGRDRPKTNETMEDFKEPGFAAQGKICGFTTGTPGDCGGSESAADGVYGYDSTTGNKQMSRVDDGYDLPWGNNLRFVNKGSLEENDAGTITYPFPQLVPVPKSFKVQACPPLTPTNVATCTPTASNDYFLGNPPTQATWDTLLDQSNPNRVAFIDAQNQTINFDAPGNAEYKGILVVWCGDLQQNQRFKGIILNLYGDGTDFGSTNCADDPSKGVYRNNGVPCQCWMYAEGGTETRAGIEIGPGSAVRFLPSGDWSFLSGFFTNPPPTSFEPQGWRELYE
jgi:hypothetical protein